MSPRLWVVIVGLLVAAQMGLMAHQTQHHFAVAADDCALCQVVSSMSAGPAAPLLVLPVFVLIATVALAVPAAPRRPRLVRAFHSRGPPALLP